MEYFKIVFNPYHCVEVLTEIYNDSGKPYQFAQGESVKTYPGHCILGYYVYGDSDLVQGYVNCDIKQRNSACVIGIKNNQPFQARGR